MAAKLRLLQFCERGGGKQRVGVEVAGGRVVDVTAVDPAIPSDMKTFLQNFDANTAAASKSVDASVGVVWRGHTPHSKPEVAWGHCNARSAKTELHCTCAFD